MNKKIVILLIILVSVIIGGVVYSQYQPESSDKTANWEVYINEEYGFLIKYPSNFYVEKSETGENFWVGFADKMWENKSVNNPELFVSVIKTSLSAQDWLNRMGTEISIFNENTPVDAKYYSVNDENNIVAGVDNIPAIQFKSSAMSGGGIFAIMKNSKNGLLIEIQAHSSGLGDFSETIYKQILSTFKFTK